MRAPSQQRRPPHPPIASQWAPPSPPQTRRRGSLSLSRRCVNATAYDGGIPIRVSALRQWLGAVHLVDGVEYRAGVLEQFAVGWVIRRLDADELGLQPRVVLLDMLHQVLPGFAGADHQPFGGIGHRLDDAVKIVLVIPRVA